MTQEKTTRWFWVRHAPVPSGGRIYGQRDLPCDVSERAVFAALAAYLPKGAVWVTSNLRRTSETAQAIIDAGLPAPDGYEPVADFAEQNLGDWQGMDRAAFFASRKQTEHPLWFAAACERAPHGESFDDLLARTRRAVADLNARHAGRDIIAVTHGGTIRAALSIALTLDPDAAMAFLVDNCSVTRLTHMGRGEARFGWRVEGVNEQPWIAHRTQPPGGLA